MLVDEDVFPKVAANAKGKAPKTDTTRIANATNANTRDTDGSERDFTAFASRLLESAFRLAITFRNTEKAKCLANEAH